MDSPIAILGNWAPEMSASTQHFLTRAYGLLLLAILVSWLPHWRRYFVGERWGGYARASAPASFLTHPAASAAIAAAWFASASGLALGQWLLAAAAANLAICYYYFVALRWHSLARGMGAPGFMPFWLGAAVLLLELCSALAPAARPAALLAIQVDLACIFLSAGVSKTRAGFMRNEGVEYGLANPMWGHWWRFYKRFDPGHPLMRMANHLAWSVQIAAAVLMLLPPTRLWGGVLLFALFFPIGFHIRLGWLCPAVMLCCVVFVPPGSVPDQWFELWLPTASAGGSGPVALWQWVAAAALLIYALLRPLALAGLWLNYYGRKALPGALQPALERYCNFFGIILWRVFTSDLTCFHIDIFNRTERGEKITLSHYGRWFGRFHQVVESIALICLFMQLKYFAHQRSAFEERLLHYARTLPQDGETVFRYIAVVKADGHFDHIPVVEFTVDAARQRIDTRVLDPSIPFDRGHDWSHMVRTSKLGSYLPDQ